MEKRTLLSVKEDSANVSPFSTGLLATPSVGFGTPVTAGFTPSIQAMTIPSLSVNPVAPITQGKEDFMTSSNIEEALIKSGYVPKTRIVTRGDDGSVETHYIKTVNRRGQTAYVELDEPGHVTTSKDDMVMVKSKSASSIPYSVRAGLYDCLDMDVCGAAFECEDEVCVVSRKPTELEPSETVLTTAEKTASKSVLDHSSPIAYPVVRMSEVVRDPDMVDEAVSGATSTIRFNAYEKCNEIMVQMEERASSLSKDVMTLRRIHASTFNRLTSTTIELEGMRRRYSEVPENSTENKKYHLLLYNLTKRNEMQEDLFQLCQMVREYSENISEIDENIKRAGNYIMDNFGNIEYVFEKDF